MFIGLALLYIENMCWRSGTAVDSIYFCLVQPIRAMHDGPAPGHARAGTIFMYGTAWYNTVHGNPRICFVGSKQDKFELFP